MTKPSTLWIRSFSWLVLLAKRHVASMTSQSVHRSKITAEDASIRNTTIPLSIILCIFVLSTSCPQTHCSDKIHLSQVVHMLSTSCPQVVYNLSTKSSTLPADKTLAYLQDLSINYSQKLNILNMQKHAQQ